MVVSPILTPRSRVHSQGRREGARLDGKERTTFLPLPHSTFPTYLETGVLCTAMVL